MSSMIPVDPQTIGDYGDLGQQGDEDGLSGLIGQTYGNTIAAGTTQYPNAVLVDAELPDSKTRQVTAIIEVIEQASGGQSLNSIVPQLTLESGAGGAWSQMPLTLYDHNAEYAIMLRGSKFKITLTQVNILYAPTACQYQIKAWLAAGVNQQVPINLGYTPFIVPGGNYPLASLINIPRGIAEIKILSLGNNAFSIVNGLTQTIPVFGNVPAGGLIYQSIAAGQIMNWMPYIFRDSFAIRNDAANNNGFLVLGRFAN